MSTPTNPPASRAREDMKMNDSITCRGSMALGSGCGHCRRCREEVAKWGGPNPPANTVPTIGADGMVWLKPVIEPERRERIALALLIAMCPVGPDGPGKYAIVNAIDAADRFIAELDGVPY